MVFGSFGIHRASVPEALASSIFSESRQEPLTCHTNEVMGLPNSFHSENFAVSLNYHQGMVPSAVATSAYSQW
jgi:hypothetical protein